MNNKGQSVLSEHVMIFFVVIAALVAMTTYVQRGFEARIHDTRDYMINAVNSVCDVNCQQAAGGNIYYEYEPYYSQRLSYVLHNEVYSNSETPGINESIGAIYYKWGNESTQAISTSAQLPPACAGANPPAYCAGL